MFSKCFVCHHTAYTERHHICHGRGKRKSCGNEFSIINLCYECHRGTNGVHGKNGAEKDLQLKLYLQKLYFDMGHDEDTVRRMLGGKLYFREGNQYEYKKNANN